MMDAKRQFEELKKEHEYLTMKYAELEAFEAKLKKDKKISEAEREHWLRWLSSRYGMLAKHMEILTKKAAKLKESLD